MAEGRKLAAILVADVVGYSRLAGADEERTLARLRALRSDLIGPSIGLHHGRVVKGTGDGFIAEFRSAVDAIRCALEVQTGMLERNTGIQSEQRLELRIGVHVGDVVEESDGDLMGDGVNIAARLESAAAPGTICLSEDAYRHVRHRLELHTEELGLLTLKNIAEPVQAFRVSVGPGHFPKKPPGLARPPLRLPPAAWKVGLAAPLVIILGAALYGVGSRRVSPGEAGHLSIVVLPFANLSSDPSQDYFADGVTENLTTDLSRIRGSFVVARNTAFTYKGKTIDAKLIGRELGVRYLLEGSVQRERSRVRVNAQLIDAATGSHLWADRFEADMADLFKLQDQVVARLANTLRYELNMAEAQKAARAQNPDAIDLSMRGWALLPVSLPSKDQVEAARPLFDQALRIDPENSEALAGQATVSTFEYLYAPKAEINYEAVILGLTEKALRADSGNLHAYRAKAQYLIFANRPGDAVRVLDVGLAVNPNAAILLALRGNALDYLGRFEEARADIQEAMLLSPRDPAMAQWLNLRADTELGLGRYDEALEDSQRALEGGHRVFYTYINLAVAHAFKGDLQDAKAALSEARRLNPSLSVEWLKAHKPVLQFAFPQLRSVGLPDGQ
jgi:TolB-like protein/class 3 adenylate cyclase